MRRALIAALVSLTLAGPTSADTLTAASGDLSASISWKPANFEASDVRLTIARAGETVLDQEILDPSGLPTTNTPVGLKARDLDGDGQPEVIADLYTNGAHCCLYSLIERYDPARGDFITVRHAWGNVSYRLRRLGVSSGLEFVSADDRFAYAFSCYACSSFPIQIWRYERTGLVDATRDYPALILRDAARQWRSYRRIVRSNAPDVRGVLAAWAADQALLGKARAAFGRLAKLEQRGILNGDAPWPAGPRYIRELKAFLKKTGYT